MILLESCYEIDLTLPGISIPSRRHVLKCKRNSGRRLISACPASRFSW